MDNRPIGLFDSGFGGLTVLKELNKKIPNENFIYYADSNRAPYGSKDKKTVQRYSEEITRFLLEKNVKMVVIACNTATSYSMDYLKNKFSIPIIGIIDAGSKYALDETKNQGIVVLATDATTRMHAYLNTIKEQNAKINVQEIACSNIVPLIESGKANSEEMIETIKTYYGNVRDKSFDTIILGCTHYALVREYIEEVFGKDKIYINPAIKLTEDIISALHDKKLINQETKKGSRDFYTSGDIVLFRELGSSYYGERIDSIFKKEF